MGKKRTGRDEEHRRKSRIREKRKKKNCSAAKGFQALAAKINEGTRIGRTSTRGPSPEESSQEGW